MGAGQHVTVALRQSRPASLWLVAATLILGGCGETPSERQPEVQSTPTFAEYEQAVFAFRDCMAEAGTPLPDLVRMKRATFDVYEYSVPAAGVDNGTDEACYVEHLASADAAWQAQIADYFKQHPAEDPTHEFLVQCAARHKVVVPPGSDINAYAAALEVVGIDPTECLDSYVAK